MNLNNELNGFIKHNNYNIVSAENGSCVMTADITESSLNPYGTAHGGFIFGLADTAAGIAAKTFGRNAMTVSADIDYLHAGKGNMLKADATCIKNGRTIAVFEVSIYDEKRLIAKSSMTYFYVD